MTGSAVMTSSAETISSACAPPPTSQKLAGLPAGLGDDVESRHDEAGAVAEDADVAVELHVGEALAPGQRLLRRQRAPATSRSSARSGWRYRALSSIVTLASSARTSPSGVTIERVDLAEHRLALDEGLGRASATIAAICFCSAGSVTPAVEAEPRGPGRAGSRRADRRGAGRVASGERAATSSMSMPPSVVNMKSGCFSPRSNVSDR